MRANRRLARMARSYRGSDHYAIKVTSVRLKALYHLQFGIERFQS